MAKQRVSINGITKWKEIEETPRQVAPVVEEAKVVPLRQAIGEVLRDVRQRQGRTLREVSQRARVSLGYLSEVERGQKEASSELLAWICQALDIPMSQMLREVADRRAVLEAFRFRILFRLKCLSSTRAITTFSRSNERRHMPR